MSRPLQGIIIPHPELTPSAILPADSSYTEQGPRPGALVPQGRTGAVLEATGTPAAGEALQLQTLVGGYAPDATFVWRPSSTSSWLGWDSPLVLRGWEWHTRLPDGGPLHFGTPAVLGLQSGVVLLAIGVHFDPSTYSVQVSRLVPGGAWVGLAAVSTGPTVAPGPHPCLLQLPSGRILLYHWANIGSAAQCIRILSSDDDGATWSVLSARGSPAVNTDATVGFTPGKIVAAFAGGEVCVVADLLDNAGSHRVLAQWASDSLGYQLTHVGTGDPTDADQRLQMPALFGHPAGGFQLICHANTAGEWQRRALASGSTVITGATATTMHPALPEDGAVGGTWFPDIDELTGWVAADGTWRLASVSTDNTGIYGCYSRDGGENWYNTPGLDRGNSHANNGVGPVCSTFAPGIPRTIAATDVRGLTVWGCQFTLAVDAHGDDSIAILYSGGATSLSMPALGGRDQHQWVAPRQWLGVDKPDAGSWTAVGAGIGTVQTAGFAIATTANTRVYTLVDTGGNTFTPQGSASIGDLLVAEFDLTPTTAGNVVTAKISASASIADGTDEYTVVASFAATGFHVVDANAGTVLANVTVDTTDGIRIRVYLAAGVATVYYMAGAAQSEPVPRWTHGGSGAVASDTASPLAHHQVSWGHGAAGTEGSLWRYVGIACARDSSASGVTPGVAVFEEGSDLLLAWSGEVVGDVGAAFATPATLLGRRFSADRSQVSGLSVRMVDGPTAGGDAWSSVSRADYPIRRIHAATSPSPSVVWRSIDDSADQVITWALPAVDSLLAEHSGLAVYIAGANWRLATLSTWDGAMWTDIATIDTSSGLASLPFQRRGDRVFVDPGGIPPTPIPAWLHRNELAGCTFDFGGGVRRRILRSSSGRWSPTSAVGPELVLEGVTGSEPTSGVFAVYRRNVAAFIPGAFFATKLRLTITAVDTVDGWLEAGTVLIGSFIPLEVPGWGRGLETTPLVELVDIGSGLRASRVLTPAGRRPTRRALSIAWPEGIDTRPLYDATGTVPKWDGSHDPVSSPAATGETLAGLLEDLAGAHTPVVYVSAVESGSGTTIRYATPGPDTVIYGRVTSGNSRTAALGWEADSEVHHVSEWVIEEEL